jgi:hypothetical protein
MDDAPACTRLAHGKIRSALEISVDKNLNLRFFAAVL